MQERDYWKQMLSSVRKVLDEVKERGIVIENQLNLKELESKKVLDQANGLWTRSVQKRRDAESLQAKPGANLNEIEDLKLDADFLESSARLDYIREHSVGIEAEALRIIILELERAVEKIWLGVVKKAGGQWSKTTGLVLWDDGDNFNPRVPGGV